MAFVSQLKRYATGLVLPLVFAGVAWYFGHHALDGDRGLVAMRQMDRDILDAKDLLAKLEEERARLERRANLLRADGLDPDMLEEEARRLLNLGRADEVVVMAGANRTMPLPLPPSEAPPRVNRKPVN